MSTTFPVDEIPNWLRTYLAIEGEANEIRAHSPHVVCGLLQTPDYAAAIARSVGVRPPDDDYVERTVRLREVRQRRVHSGELSVVALQTEFSLRLRMGSGVTMAAQMANLLELGELPNVTVLVIPYSVGQYEALRIGSFSLLFTPRRAAPTVHLEGHAGGRFIVEIQETDQFAAAFDHARQRALPPPESRKFVATMREEWETSDE